MANKININDISKDEYFIKDGIILIAKVKNEFKKIPFFVQYSRRVYMSERARLSSLKKMSRRLARKILW